MALVDAQFEVVFVEDAQDAEHVLDVFLKGVGEDDHIINEDNDEMVTSIQHDLHGVLELATEKI